GRIDPALKRQIIDSLKRRHRERASALRGADCRTPEPPLIRHVGRTSGNRLIRPYGPRLSSALGGLFAYA
ncbi:hypothetical protein ACFQY9_25500, partial [Microvirga aerilata]|uniref:hypothetical protein n=1 Tax=Microvirga aerilata TaxID=670292 RepID=UPI00363943A4